jgi:predicted membrane protein
MACKFSNWVWGTFLLLAAVLVIANQSAGFVEIGVFSFIAAALALAFIVQCIASLSFTPLPIPLAALYYIFQEPFGFPPLQFWPLALAALLATVGLSVLFPQKGKRRYVHIIHDGEPKDRPEKHVESDGGNDNNPSVSVNFGSVSRYIHADCLETVTLNCSFGALEIYFDHAQLSPDGAEVNVNCSFGGIEIFVPRHWQVVDNVGCTLGGVDINSRRAVQTENAPRLTLNGNVTLGDMDVKYV